MLKSHGKHAALALVAALALASARDSAAAGTAGSTLAISAKVDPVCTITAGTIAFGSYNPLATADLDQSGTFTVTCAKGTAYTVGIGLGGNASGTTRRMSDGASPANFLSYEIYTTTARTTVWNSANTVGGTAPSKAAITLTAFGRVPSGQDVPTAASYADSVVTTVNF